MPATLSVFGRYPAAKWITLVGGALTLGFLAALCVKRRRSSGFEQEIEEFRSYVRTMKRIKGGQDDVEREMEFLVSRIRLCKDDTDKAKLLVTLSNDMALRPTFDKFVEGDFPELLRKLILSPNENVREKSLLACCNFVRSPNIHRCESLINALIGQMVFLRYAQDFKQLNNILSCLVNVSVDKGTHQFFVPTLEILGEIISHQGPGKIAKVRLDAWRIIMNLIMNPDMVLSFAKLPWQWLVAIDCDVECEVRRISFFTHMLDYFLAHPNQFACMSRGNLMVVLTSPMTNEQLKERFSKPNIPSHLEYISRPLRQKLDRVFDMTRDEARRRAALQDDEVASDELRFFAFEDYCSLRHCAPSRLCPDPEKGAYGGRKNTFPHHMLEQWDERTLRNAAVRAVNWYNCMASRCQFRLGDRLPVALLFLEYSYHEVPNFIGVPSRNWNILLSDKVEDQLKTYMETGEPGADAAYRLPDCVLGSEKLIGKEIYGVHEAEDAKSSMNTILDELAILCVPLYRDVMQFREIPYEGLASSLPSNRGGAADHRGYANRRVNNLIPEAERVRPYRPFMSKGDDSSFTEEFAAASTDLKSTNSYYEHVVDEVATPRSQPPEPISDVSNYGSAEDTITTSDSSSSYLKSTMSNIVSGALEAAFDRIMHVVLRGGGDGAIGSTN